MKQNDRRDDAVIEREGEVVELGVASKDTQGPFLPLPVEIVAFQFTPGGLIAE